MKTIINSLIMTILILSIVFNIFMLANYQTTCENIDTRRKADVLYKLGHKSLDGDGDGIACEDLPYNEQ